MAKQSLLFLFTFCCIAASLAQQDQFFTIEGVVIDGENGEAMPGVNVFLNNTSYKGQSDLNGEFQIRGVQGTYDLVVHQQGYQTFLREFSSDTIEGSLTIKLFPLSFDIPALEISAKRSPEWYENLARFKDAFLGNTTNGEKCEILNDTILIMDLDEDKQRLEVRAYEPLQILNASLGYTINFLLEGFVLNLKQNTVYYSGYASFSEVGKKRRRYERRREQAYYGSIQHWLKSLSAMTAKEEGYDMAILTIGGKNGLPPIQLQAGVEGPQEWFYEDELQYHNGVLLLSGPKTIEVGYQNEMPSSRYRQLIDDWSTREQTSQVTFSYETVFIYPNGHYTPPTGLVFTGHMAWERVGDMLPMDYVPDHDR